MNQSMNRILIRVAFLVICAPALATPTLADEVSNQAKDSEDDVYYYGSFTRFQPGKEDEARSFIYQHFWTVDKVIGRKPIPFDFVTGPWDHVVFFRLENGLADAEIEKTAMLQQWKQQFEKQEGGSEEAAKAQANFDAMVDQTVSGLFKIPSDDVEVIENAYSWNAKESYFRVQFVNYKAGKKPAATDLIMKYFRPARQKIDRVVVPLFSVAGPYDQIVFIQIEPSSLESITADSQDAAWIQAMGGEEKAAKARSLYNGFVQQDLREIAIGRWCRDRAARH